MQFTERYFVNVQPLDCILSIFVQMWYTVKLPTSGGSVFWIILAPLILAFFACWTK